MLAIRATMPASLVPMTQSPYCPQLPRLKEFGCGFESHSRPSKLDTSNSAPRIEESSLGQPDTHGSKTMNGNSQSNSQPGSWQTRPAPVVSSNAPPYPTPQSVDGGHHSRSNSKPEPFYNNYYSAKYSRSPVKSKESEPVMEQANQRRLSSGGIATHLQIPPSINSTKGSLPEFAAQITCLFWFEASSTLSAIENSQWSSPNPVVPLVNEALPTTGFRKWVTTILSMTNVSPNLVLLALLFIYRLKKHNPSVKGKVGSEFRLFTVALMLGNKFLDDNTYTNKTWADVSGISVQEIHVMEVEFLSNMRYSLFASKEEWEDWHSQLNRFSLYYDKASRPPNEFSPQSLVLPAPRISIPSNLPSPPISQHSSPPYVPQISPTHNGVPHPLSMPPLLPSTAVSSGVGTPTSDTGAWPRKRSLEDYAHDPPVKRVMSSMSSASSNSITPLVTSSSAVSSAGPLTPTARDFSPWKLPPPQSFSGHRNGVHSSPPQPLHQLPGGRAMASVYQTHPKRAQLPSLHLPYTQGQPSSLSYADHQLSNSTPYTHSQTPSPTAYNFPHHQTPTGLSPTGFAGPRNSPYKPIRRVNTLLVPPPSSSVQQAPQHLSYDQMHYRPLGGSRNEQRTGVLPVHHFFTTWSDNAHQMPPQLPPPQLQPLA